MKNMKLTEYYISEIKRMKAEKNAIILAHYYQTGDIQDIADFVGDSLAFHKKLLQIMLILFFLQELNLWQKLQKYLLLKKKFFFLI